MPSAPWYRPVRSAALLLALVAGLGWASGPLARQLLGGAALDFEAALAASAAGIAWAAVLWFCGCLVLALLGRLPGAAGRAARHTAAAVTPALMRRLLEAALGASIAVAATGQVAYAAAGTPGGTSELPRVDRPDRPAAHQPSAPDPDRPGGDREHRKSRASTVRVRRGDTLWAIAAAHLPGTPDDAAIAANWPRWYAANRHVIGSDPNLILPGQRLRPPKPG
ncbi:MAG: LysM peptidoglycan-binding domain-containing protein [Streptosporangiales bacterium]